MSVSNTQSREGAESASPVKRAQSLLAEALELIDSHADAPEIGARLQEVIDALQSRYP